MSDDQFLFLGRLIPTQYDEEVRSKMKNSMPDAANALQWNIISGIEKNIKSSICIHNTLPIGSYPQYYSDIFIKRSLFKHSDINDSNTTADVNIGFINLKFVRDLLKNFFVYPNIRRWVSQKSNGSKVIMTYTLDNAYLNSIIKAKRIDSNIISCAIIADLPIYSNLSSNQSIALRYYIKYKNYLINKKIKHIDSFVIISEHMKEIIPPNKPYTVIECIAETDMMFMSHDASKTKKILYSGTLHKKFGILTLLDAFSLIEDFSYELIICGIGDTEEEIKKRAEFDKRIKYLGKLNRKDVLMLQRQASVLVNPRPNNEIYTKYSFPSKTAEYLVSGTPVVAYKLLGIPDEYDRYITYIKGDTPEDLKNAIINVLNKSERERENMGSLAYEFMVNHKNSVVQTKKILDMIDAIKN